MEEVIRGLITQTLNNQRDMKPTTKSEGRKRDELERLWYFGGRFLKDNPPTETDINNYFTFSERGIEPISETIGYKALNEAKRWQGIHIHEMYEPGVMDGSMPYFILLGGYEWLGRKRWWQFWKRQTYKPIPRSVVAFLKKEMFKGADAELIERVFNDLK